MFLPFPTYRIVFRFLFLSRQATPRSSPVLGFTLHSRRNLAAVLPTVFRSVSGSKSISQKPSPSAALLLSGSAALSDTVGSMRFLILPASCHSLERGRAGYFQASRLLLRLPLPSLPACVSFSSTRACTSFLQPANLP